MVLVSACCEAPVVDGYRKEFPLGGSTWYETHTVDVCDKCEKECEVIETEDEEDAEVFASR